MLVGLGLHSTPSAHRHPGKTNEELAVELYVSPSAVNTHPADVQRRLAARNRVEIAAWAWDSSICATGQGN